MDAVRNRLEALMAERGDDCLSLSRLLNRNAAYVQQFLKRGVPRALHERDRRTLAQYYGVDESELGGLDPAARSASPAIAMVKRLHLGASAGPGATGDGEEAVGQFGFDPRWLRQLGANPGRLSIIQVAGDSMEPTLADGDDIMVDDSDGAAKLREGIYVIRHDDQLLVKRVAMAKGGRISVVSDNAAYPRWEAGAGEIDIVGRVVWTGHRVK
jgi:phage repressor protein C with HTH and peptisase S24 domain